MLAKGNKNKLKMANTNFEIWFEIAVYGNWKKTREWTLWFEFELISVFQLYFLVCGYHDNYSMLGQNVVSKLPT